MGRKKGKSVKYTTTIVEVKGNNIKDQSQKNNANHVVKLVFGAKFYLRKKTLLFYY